MSSATPTKTTGDVAARLSNTAIAGAVWATLFFPAVIACIILFDERDAAQVRKALDAGHEILEECIACGGSVTGEHGIGFGKIAFLEAEHGSAVAVMRQLKATLDPDNRILLQVKVEDADVTDEIFTRLMGDVVEPRRDFIQENALNVANLDV